MFSRIARLSTAMIVAGGSAVTDSCLLGLGAPGARIGEGTTLLELPTFENEKSFRWVDWSNDLLTWQTVARDYGFDWQNTYPEVLPIRKEAELQLLVDADDAGQRYFRIMESEPPILSNAQCISRFLQQATFGPTRNHIFNFPGFDASDLNESPYVYYDAWIDIEIAKPAFSLRRFFRERSNPEFVNDFAKSPDEVGHNPVLGQQLTYNIGQDKFYPDTADAIAAGRNSTDVLFSPQETKQIVWYQAVCTAPDVLRQRVAWALAQLFVVGEAGSNQVQATEKFLSYYDIFVNNAFGNFRDILGEVTYHPLMGYYLTYVDNRKEDLERGIFPDENFAREVMQLFTIGLWMLNQDGTLVLDAHGEPIPTYDNDDIENIARIFTGLRKQAIRGNIEIISGNYVDPMRVQVSWHDFTVKTLMDGSRHGPYPYSEEGARQDINEFLDFLVDHSNTPPFVARYLIQRLTVSNPSPRYVHDVAQAFIDGTHNSKGSGRRGDMSAVIRAILLHPEAREPVLSGDAAYGRLREPLIRLLHYARAFEITSPQTHGLFPFYQLDTVIDESPFNFPSVFSFYLPEYQPLGSIQDAGLFAPEFQIHTDVTSLNLANCIRTLVYEGIQDEIGRRGYSQGDLDLAFEINLASDIDALLDHLDLMLTAGRLTSGNRAIIANTLEEMPSGNTLERSERVQLALSLFSLLPEYNVLH